MDSLPSVRAIFSNFGLTLADGQAGIARSDPVGALTQAIQARADRKVAAAAPAPAAGGAGAGGAAAGAGAGAASDKMEEEKEEKK